MALTRDEWRERLLDQGIDEDTADLMCREYADDEEDEPVPETGEQR